MRTRSPSESTGSSNHVREGLLSEEEGRRFLSPARRLVGIAKNSGMATPFGSREDDHRDHLQILKAIERREEASELCLYVLDGNIQLTVGDEQHAANRGAFAFVPRRTMLRVAAERSARLLLWRTPAR